MIAIIDYQAGNLNSVRKALQSFGKDAVITSSPRIVKKADRLVLPGVGNFAAGMKMLKKKRLDLLIRQEIKKGKLFLGICLGMQLLFSRSEEASAETGLGVFPGTVRKFSSPRLIVPHMGWNSVNWKDAPGFREIFKGIKNESYFYFAHSYYCPSGNFSRGITRYGLPFTSFLTRENVFGTQFHPEKSQTAGLRFLRNFCALRA